MSFNKIKDDNLNQFKEYLANMEGQRRKRNGEGSGRVEYGKEGFCWPMFLDYVNKSILLIDTILENPFMPSFITFPTKKV